MAYFEIIIIFLISSSNFFSQKIVKCFPHLERQEHEVHPGPGVADLDAEELLAVQAVVVPPPLAAEIHPGELPLSSLFDAAACR